MLQERPVSESDLLKVARYLRGFDIIKIERHDEAGGFRFISKHCFFNKGPNGVDNWNVYGNGFHINHIDPDIVGCYRCHWCRSLSSGSNISI